MSLPEAIAKVRAIHDREQHLAAPREVMAKHLGYNGMNGSSLKAMSALLKYGLIEKTKDDKRKVTDLAVSILHPRAPEHRRAAITDAASRPALFQEIAKEWDGSVPSDENLRAFLIHRNFSQDAIPEVIKAYRETAELVASEGGEYAPGITPEPLRAEKPLMRTPMTHVVTSNPLSHRGQAAELPEGEPYRVSFTPNGMEIVGRIADAESAEALIAVISALKLLLRPAGRTPRPDTKTGPDAEEEEALEEN